MLRSRSFRHNRGRFAVSILPSQEALEGWNRRGKHWADGERGSLQAQASVIAASRLPGDDPEVIEVEPGDILVTAWGNFRIQDDVALSDPRLVEVK